MNYGAPAYGVAPVAAKAGTSKLVIIVAVVIGTIVVIGALGIGLGVGFGVGLHINTGSSTLSAPTITCNATNISSTDVCGCPTTAGKYSSRIFSGSTATASSWPWMVVVNAGSRTCSGFLIDPQYVITAANCVYNINYNTITVYLGITKISDTTDRVTRSLANVTIPSGYVSTSPYNDIAVLKLNESVTFSSTIAQCCFSYDTTLPTVGETAVIAGWGQTSFISGISDSLRQAVVQVKSPSACGISSTNSSLFCAGYGSVETCPGDNGGPLMISTNNTWTCAGVIIGGSSVCYMIGGYTQLSSYYDFILLAMV